MVTGERNQGPYSLGDRGVQNIMGGGRIDVSYVPTHEAAALKQAGQNEAKRDVIVNIRNSARALFLRVLVDLDLSKLEIVRVLRLGNASLTNEAEAVSKFLDRGLESFLMRRDVSELTEAEIIEIRRQFAELIPESVQVQSREVLRVELKTQKSSLIKVFEGYFKEVDSNLYKILRASFSLAVDQVPGAKGGISIIQIREVIARLRDRLSGEKQIGRVFFDVDEQNYTFKLLDQMLAHIEWVFNSKLID